MTGNEYFDPLLDRLPTAEEVYFDKLPALQAADFANQWVDPNFSLLLKTRTDGGDPLIFPIEYKHRELIWMTPDSNHPVARGLARSDGSEEFKEVRIIISPSRGTATLKGLDWLEGQVKKASPGESNRRVGKAQRAHAG